MTVTFVRSCKNCGELVSYLKLDETTTCKCGSESVLPGKGSKIDRFQGEVGFNPSI